MSQITNPPSTQSWQDALAKPGYGPSDIQRVMAETKAAGPTPGLASAIPNTSKNPPGTDFISKYPANSERFFHAQGQIAGVDPKLMESVRKLQRIYRLVIELK